MQFHICGGTILTGGSGAETHSYCDKCHAFRVGNDGTLPDGVDLEANRAAWAAGDDESPAPTPEPMDVSLGLVILTLGEPIY